LKYADLSKAIATNSGFVKLEIQAMIRKDQSHIFEQRERTRSAERRKNDEVPGSALRDSGQRCVYFLEVS
jgi:hypothetical protein